jgi:hypothetical protein
MCKRTGVSLLLVAGALVVSACSGAASESTESLPSTTLAATSTATASTETSTSEAIQISDFVIVAIGGCVDNFITLDEAISTEDIDGMIGSAVAMIRTANEYRTGQPLLPDDERVYQAIESCDGIGKTWLAEMLDSGVQHPALDQFEPVLDGAWDFSAEEFTSLAGDYGFQLDSFFEALKALESDIDNWEAP